MKNLSIAGTVSSSNLVELKGTKYLEVNVALNHVKPCEWIKVLTTNVMLTVEQGSRISASGTSEEKAYIKDGNAIVNRTLWASFFEVIYSPGKQDNLDNSVKIENDVELTEKPQSSIFETPLSIAINSIDAAKSIKQCNFYYHQLIKVMENEKDREIAIIALNNRKKILVQPLVNVAVA